MSLYGDWKELAQAERSRQEYDAFWKTYFETETEAYKKILENHDRAFAGKLSALAEELGMSETLFMGFLDGINTSLKPEAALELESLTGESEIKLDVDFEQLYFNMLDAKAPWLYELPQWDNVLSEFERKEIVKKYRSAKVFIKAQEIGRNDPCPCGSGKKYKKCCGKAL